MIGNYHTTRWEWMMCNDMDDVATLWPYLAIRLAKNCPKFPKPTIPIFKVLVECSRAHSQPSQSNGCAASSANTFKPAWVDPAFLATFFLLLLYNNEYVYYTVVYSHICAHLLIVQQAHFLSLYFPEILHCNAQQEKLQQLVNYAVGKAVEQ